MTTLEINTSDIFAIDKLRQLAKEKFNFDINVLKVDSIDEEKYYKGYEADKKRLHKVYNDIKSGKAKLYNEKESKVIMDEFMLKLKKKYGNR